MFTFVKRVGQACYKLPLNFHVKILNMESSKVSPYFQESKPSCSKAIINASPRVTRSHAAVLTNKTNKVKIEDAETFSADKSKKIKTELAEVKDIESLIPDDEMPCTKWAPDHWEIVVRYILHT